MRVPSQRSAAQSDPISVAGQTVATALYRFFDANGRLLYVGITKDPQTRFAAHARTKRGSWWPLVSSKRVQWFFDRPTAARAEIRAIKTEDPAYNQSCTPSPHLVSETGGQHISLRDLEAFEWLTCGETTRRVVREGFSASMSRTRLMYLAENDPDWPVTRSEWRYLANSWLFPWELVHAYFREEPPASALNWGGHPRGETPSVVTFTSGASLLVALGVAPRMTNEGVRVASKASDWPFGDDRQHRYWKLGNAQAMATEPFLQFFQTRVKKPQSPRPTEKQSFRGELLLRLAATHFGNTPFTQADLFALGEYGRAAVSRNVKALAEQGKLTIVGQRPTESGAGRPHALYVITAERQVVR